MIVIRIITTILCGLIAVSTLMSAFKEHNKSVVNACILAFVTNILAIWCIWT